MAVFKAYMFEGSRTASKALNELEDYTPAYSWVDDVAMVSRSKDGHLRIESTWAQDERAKSGINWGAIIGGIIGLLLAKKKGAMIGSSIGGTVGGLLGWGKDVKLDDPKLDQFASSIHKNSSSLVLVGDESTMSAFSDAVEPFGGTLIETHIDDKDINTLKSNMKKSLNA
jgi:uncharacterized membrane protein